MRFFIIMSILFLNVVKSLNLQLISPIFGSSEFKNTIIENIKNANSSIKATIYKFDDDDIFNALNTVGENGIIFDMICDTNIYKKCLQLNSYGKINEFNMKSYSKLHAKSILIDNQILILGSFNLDESAFSNNMEIGVIINDKDTIDKYNNFIQKVKD